MKAPLPQIISTGALALRLAGASLVLIAFALIVLDAAGVSLSPTTGEILLLAAMAIIALAVRKMPSGMTSLIGLFFLGTILWVAPRPLFALVTQDDNVYTLFFGQAVAPRGGVLYRLLAFWIIGIASFYGGYFLFFKEPLVGLKRLDCFGRSYCKRCYILTFIILVILSPFLIQKNVTAFFSGGYEGLYLDQAQYSFSFLTLFRFLIPLLFGLAVVIDENCYSRLMFFTILLYVLLFAGLGQRKEAGTWLFVALWHFTYIQRKHLSTMKLILVLILGCFSFAMIEVLRSSIGSNGPLLHQFFIGEGIIFMIPALAWQLPTPPLHTIFGTLLPLGAVYSFCGVGSSWTAALANYISSQANPSAFETGNGLSATFYLDVFFASGQVFFLYGCSCLALGFLLRKWEEASAHNLIALFYLCICLPTIIYVQRGELNASTAIYISAFMAVAFVWHLSITTCGLDVKRKEDSDAQNQRTYECL